MDQPGASRCTPDGGERNLSCRRNGKALILIPADTTAPAVLRPVIPITDQTIRLNPSR